MIIRPDDEDSPEFKEYLKQLLKMQANRARAGINKHRLQLVEA